MSSYKTLNDLPDIRGKRVLVRSELNAPVENGVVTDSYRIEQAVPTLRELADRDAKVIVIAHIGRDPSETLAPVADVLRQLIPTVEFVPGLVGEEVSRAVEMLPEGGILLLENVRSEEGETKNDPAFADALAMLADYYVDDAFGATHRAHASIVGVPARLPAFAGRLLERELVEMEKGLQPESPSLFILGGAKFETKEPLLEAALPRYDRVFIGGALANDFLKAEGFVVGKSLVSEGAEKAAELIASGKVLLPVDVVVESPDGVVTKRADHVGPEDTIVDIGPESVTELGVHIAHARTILWNGPLGLFEKGYSKSTESVAQLVADAPGHSIVGGGDTVAAIRELDLADKFNFLSTGGGAMLDYLVDGSLPGVEALKASQ
ncbi:MAG: phosphoglycerate kinase [Candidatus Pacebacteria bacterium]|nr:phosphoglycerate kinase [Candidatus Paceibacterota bacterium]